jgi:hypothetical protein
MTRSARSARAITVAMLAVAATAAGCGDDDGQGSGPDGRPATVEELVRALYGAIGRDDADTACALFTPSGEATLLEDTAMPSCEAAIDLMAQDVVDPETYGNVTIEVLDPGATELDEWCGPATIEVEVGDGGPGPSGAFYYAQQPGGGWAVTEFNNTECPA